MFKSFKVTNELLGFRVNQVRQKPAKGPIILFLSLHKICGSTPIYLLTFINDYWMMWCSLQFLNTMKYELLLVICFNVIQRTNLVSMLLVSSKFSFFKKLIVFTLALLKTSFYPPKKKILPLHSIFSTSQY